MACARVQVGGRAVRGGVGARVQGGARLQGGGRAVRVQGASQCGLMQCVRAGRRCSCTQARTRSAVGTTGMAQSGLTWNASCRPAPASLVTSLPHLTPTHTAVLQTGSMFCSHCPTPCTCHVASSSPSSPSPSSHIPSTIHSVYSL